MRTSSFLKVLTKRFCLSAAVKKMLVRLVSTRTTSSESTGSSSFFGGVGVAFGGSLRRGGTTVCESLWANAIVARPAVTKNETQVMRRRHPNCLLFFFTVD